MNLAAMPFASFALVVFAIEAMRAWCERRRYCLTLYKLRQVRLMLACQRGTVAIEAAVVYSGLIIPTILGAILVCQAVALTSATGYTATAIASAASRAASGPSGTQSAGQNAADTVFAANKASLFSASASVSYSLAWPSPGIATATVTASAPGLLGSPVNAQVSATD